MTVDAPDRVVRQRLEDSRLAAAADQSRGQLRLEVQTQAQGQAQAAHELNLRRAAEMETGRARNIYTIA